MIERIVIKSLGVVAMLVALTENLAGQEVVIDPGNLETHSIFDEYALEIPDFIIELIQERNMSFQVYNLTEGTRLVFRESRDCHSSGCTIVILSSKGGVLFDPILFVSDEEVWYRDEYSTQEDPIGDVCVTQNVAFVC